MDKKIYGKEFGKWLGKYCWDFYATFTFKNRQFSHTAKKAFHRFLRKFNKKAEFFFAIEQDPSKRNFHIHALLRNMGDVSGEFIEKSWKKEHGIAQVFKYDSDYGASYYITKDIDKDIADFDVWFDKNARTVKEARDKITALMKPHYENGVLKGWRIRL